MVLQNKEIRKQLFRLIIIIGVAVLIEYLVIVQLSEIPILRFKGQVIIGIMLLACLAHTAYKVWDLANNPFQENGME